MDLWPSVCGAVDCKNPDCGLVDMPRNGPEGAWVVDSKGGLTSEVSIPRVESYASDHSKYL